MVDIISNYLVQRRNDRRAKMKYIFGAFVVMECPDQNAHPHPAPAYQQDITLEYIDIQMYKEDLDRTVEFLLTQT